MQVDPFVEISVRDGRSQRTKTIWNNKDPVFNQVLRFVVDDPEHQSITAMVKDDDMHAFSKVRSRTSGWVQVRLMHAWAILRHLKPRGSGLAKSVHFCGG